MSQSRLSEFPEAPARLQRLELPERTSIAGMSARRADIALLAKVPADFLDAFRHHALSATAMGGRAIRSRCR
jgi:hypothetical protein